MYKVIRSTVNQFAVAVIFQWVYAHMLLVTDANKETLVSCYQFQNNNGSVIASCLEYRCGQRVTSLPLA